MKNKFYQLSKKEIIFLISIILVYSIVGYLNLGDMTAPTSYYMMEQETPPAEFLLEEQPSSVSLYAPVNDSTKYIGIQILCSNDGVNWTLAFDTRTDDKDYTAAMIWYQYPLNTNADTRYIKIEKLESANRLALSEVAFRDAQGNIIKATPLNEGSARLLDEQNTVSEKADRMNSAYFDESYFPSSALEMQDGLSVAEMDHPPVGRLIIGLGMNLFGRNPFGFRFMQVSFGVLMLPLLYFFAKALLKSSKWAGFSTIVLALDFMHYSQTRIGTLDAFLVFFILAMYAFLYFYHISQKKRSRYIFLTLSGISMGLAIGTKWSGCYAALGLAFLYFYWLICDIRKGDSFITKARLKECLWCILVFVFIPALIYMLSYIPYAQTVPDQGFFKTFIGHQIQMFSYHTGDSTHYQHPYSSKWWTWLLALKPVFYYTESSPESIYLYGTGNPLIWGIGLLGILLGGFLAIKKKSEAGCVIFIGYFSQMIPWFFITRDTFLYHYFPMVPFLILGVGYLFQNMVHAPRYKPLRNGLALLFLVLAIFSFIAGFPFIYGSPMAWSSVLFLRKLFLIFLGIIGSLSLLLGIFDFIQTRRDRLKEL